MRSQQSNIKICVIFFGEHIFLLFANGPWSLSPVRFHNPFRWTLLGAIPWRLAQRNAICAAEDAAVAGARRNANSSGDQKRKGKEVKKKANSKSLFTWFSSSYFPQKSSGPSGHDPHLRVFERDFASRLEGIGCVWWVGRHETTALIFTAKTKDVSPTWIVVP